MSVMQRRKGANYEREVARKFAAAMPGAKVRRGLQYRDGGEEADVVCPIFWIECKRGRKPSVRKALTQAIDKAGNGDIPIAIVRDDRAEATVTMLLDDFLDFVSEFWTMLQR